IASAPELGLNRQIFFCQLGGFDTHQGQLNTLFILLDDVHRALHSFPTRRSSDLAPAADPPAARRQAGPRGRGLPHRRRQARGGRSEEHTSELQSRRELVCSLLLEKKTSSFRTPTRSRSGSRPSPTASRRRDGVAA